MRTHRPPTPQRLQPPVRRRVCSHQMRLVLPTLALLGCAATLPACGAQASDGIFDPSASGAEPTGGTSAGSADPEGSATDDDAADASEGSSAGSGPMDETGDTTDGGSTGPADQGTCPEAVGPGVYTCPEGSTFSSGDGWARCMYQDVPLPAAPSLAPYCLYLSEGYVGFYWSLGEVPTFECLPEARFAPTGQTGYCLWEDIVLPTALAEADCDGLVATGDLGFRWPCP